MSCDLTDYPCVENGNLLPLINEYTWPRGARAFIYLVGLLYSFLGVSIIADVFMQAISTITSKTQRLKVPDPEAEEGYTEVEVYRWNGTVANLTLMALGSSAPEIILSIVEVLLNDMKSGALGPSTIVGSAAFNLMCITGVCILAVPAGEVRRIRGIKVFAVTAVFSVFAYVWLALILVVITPDYVDLWEALVTFIFFPLLVVIAYIFDRDFCGKRPIDDESKLDLDADTANLLAKAKADKQVVAEVLRRLHSRKDMDPKDLANLTAHLMDQNHPHDRAWYRINAIRGLSGGNKLDAPLTDKAEELLENLLIEEQMGSTTSFHVAPEPNKAVVEFAASSTAVLEKDGHARISLMRHGNLKRRVLVHVETIDGTAEGGSDYKPYKETLVFESNETLKHIDIEIYDDNEWEPDEVFFARITADDDTTTVVGKRAVTQITILNDDNPGILAFQHPSFLFKESVGKALIPVERTDGADGKVSVSWKTKDLTAVHGRDYMNNEGVLEFEHGELTKMIEILINDDKDIEKDENFEVDLLKTTGGAQLGKLKRTVVTIVNDDEFNGFVDRVTMLTNTNLDAMRVFKQSWGEQFRQAMNVNGGDLDNATLLDYLMHFLTFGWKIIFALVPPPSIWGGWLSFLISLFMIGLLTTFIGDLASIFGCLIGFRDASVAITFVALGTSLPDLFASKQAAVMEKYADNAIGNVTGSNSVNVFMGLGVAWTIAAIYWTAQGKTFEVPAGALGFSVVIFTACSLVTLLFLVLRRNLALFGKAELGGPKGAKIFSAVFLVTLWILYVVLAILQDYSIISGF